MVVNHEPLCLVIFSSHPLLASYASIGQDLENEITERFKDLLGFLVDHVHLRIQFLFCPNLESIDHPDKDNIPCESCIAPKGLRDEDPTLFVYQAVYGPPEEEPLKVANLSLHCWEGTNPFFNETPFFQWKCG
jgi:hypothetical protein